MRIDVCFGRDIVILSTHALSNWPSSEMVSDVFFFFFFLAFWWGGGLGGGKERHFMRIPPVDKALITNTL